MATSTNLGSQRVFYHYKYPLKGETFNRGLRHFIRPGVYKGLRVSIVSGNTINVTLGQAAIPTSFNGSDVLLALISFGSGVNLSIPQTISGEDEILYLHYDYAEVTENYAEFAHDSQSGFDSSPNQNWVALARLVYDGSGNITAINYDYRRYGLTNADDNTYPISSAVYFCDKDDVTKKVGIDATSLSSSSTRSLKVPDENQTINAVSDWQPLQNYLKDSIRVNGGVSYRALSDHTSTNDFQTDFLGGLWEVFGSPNSGAGASVTVNKPAHGNVVGQRLRHVAGVDWVPAIADDPANVGTGIVSDASTDQFTVLLEGEVELTTAEWDAVLQTGESGSGLVDGAWYYLSETEPGKITQTQPAITDWALKALSPTKAMVVDYPAVSSGKGNTVVTIEGTATSGQTSIPLPAQAQDPGFVFLWVNGVKQPPSSYSVSGNNIVVSTMSDGDTYEAQALISYPIANSGLIVNDPGTNPNQALSQKAATEIGKQVGEVWASVIDKPLSPEFRNIRIDQEQILTQANHPDIFSALYNQQVAINGATQFTVAAVIDNAGFAELQLALTANELSFVGMLYDDFLYHGSYANWRTLTIPSDIGGLLAGTYEIKEVDPIANSITLNQGMPGTTGSGVCEGYWFRVVGSTTTVRWFAVTDSVIRSPGGDAVPGVRLLDRFQGHWHKFFGDNNGATGAGTSGTVNDSVLQPAINVKDAVTDGVNGDPRTGPTTRDRSLSAIWYMYIGRYIP